MDLFSDLFSGVDWVALFRPTQPLLATFLRGTITYLALFILLRIIRKRQVGSISTADILMVVLLADAAQNALAGDYQSITDGLLLVATILGWNYAIDWLGYRARWAEHWIRPAPLKIIENGEMLEQNMQRELITEGELRSLLREQGLEDLSKIGEAYIEGDGRISIIQRTELRRDGTDQDAHPRRA